jgi:Flp pilus assembly protein CpaB
MLAALFGVLSAALMFAFLSSRGGSDDALDDALVDTGEVESVVVLNRDVDFGVEITPEMVSLQPVPLSALLPGVFTDVSDVVGKVTTTKLYASEQVIPGKITSFEEQNSLAFKVPDGHRAISLMIPHEAWGAAGLAQPGDRVDVLGITTLVSVDPLTGAEKLDVVSGIIAENVAVLAVSQTVVKIVPNLDERAAASGDPDAEATPGAGTVTGSDPAAAFRPLDETATYETAISITLALPPDVAAKVAIIDAMKDDQGQFRIMPRQQGDNTELEGQVTWTLDEVFDLTK